MEVYTYIHRTHIQIKRKDRARKRHVGIASLRKGSYNAGCGFTSDTAGSRPIPYIHPRESPIVHSPNPRPPPTHDTTIHTLCAHRYIHTIYPAQRNFCAAEFHSREIRLEGQCVFFLKEKKILLPLIIWLIDPKKLNEKVRKRER